MITSNKITLSIVLVAALVSVAISVRAVPAEKCAIIKTYKEALQCTLANHPNVLRADAERARSANLENQASQRPNLEFSGKGLRNTQDSAQSNGEVDIAYTFELGGKRSSRIEKARLAGELGKVDLEISKDDVLVRTLADLHRLKYLETESILIEDGISTFERITKSYRGRLKLSPEQDVSLSVFMLALEDYKIRKSQLKVQKIALLKELELNTGSSVEISEALFPQKTSTWPDIVEAPQSSLKPSPIRLLETSLKIAEAETKIAQSEAWPDVKIGPDYEWSHSPSNTEQSLGIILTLPLPIWNRNQGGIAVANAEAARARLNLDLTQKELAFEKATFLAKYQEGVKVIRSGISEEDMRKRQKNLRAQFEQGLISSSLVIEANRQILELTKSRNEQELATLEALWNLKRLEGNLLEEAQ